MEVIRSWSEPNTAYYKDKKEEFEKAITEMEWKLVTSEMQLPLQTGFAIKEFVNKLQLPRVSHIALSDAFEPYGFYGLRTHYGDGQVEIYILDTGLAGAVICSDKHPMPVDKETLIKKWIEIGKANEWISEAGSGNPEHLTANEEPFGRSHFYECITVEELKARFLKGNWCLGQAYFYKNLCFINQDDGGDEWLAIRDDISFNSITWIRKIENHEGEKGECFEDVIQRMLVATPEQLKRLEY